MNVNGSIFNFNHFNLNHSVYEETALINNERYCQKCVSIKFPNETAKFEKTDAKLSCPAMDNKCGAKNLSCDQFMVGTCCENAPYWKDDTG